MTNETLITNVNFVEDIAKLNLFFEEIHITKALIAIGLQSAK